MIEVIYIVEQNDDLLTPSEWLNWQTSLLFLPAILVFLLLILLILLGNDGKEDLLLLEMVDLILVIRLYTFMILLIFNIFVNMFSCLQK